MNVVRVDFEKTLRGAGDRPAARVLVQQEPSPPAAVRGMDLHIRQLSKRYREAKGGYALTLDALKADDIRVEELHFQPVMQGTSLAYQITANGFDGVAVHIDQDGRVWTTRRRNDP